MAGDASRRNGKLGGRPRGPASIIAEKMRDRVAKEVDEKYDALWRPQFTKALKGDIAAFKEIREFAFGKNRQNVGLDGGEDGAPVEISSLRQLPDHELQKLAAGESGAG